MEELDQLSEEVEDAIGDLYTRYAEMVESLPLRFSSPVLSMGKRETNVKKLKNLRLSAPKDNKDKIDVVINLYDSGKMPNYLTAENLIERLASKTKRKSYIDKTEKEFARIANKYTDAQSVKGILTRSSEKKREPKILWSL